MPVRFVTDGAAMQEMLRQPGGIMWKDMTRRGDMLIGLAQTQLLERKRTRDDEARLEAGIVKRIAATERGIVVTVIASSHTDPDYAYWVHEGNGPQGGRIFPTTKKFLVFEGADGSEIFVKSVRTSTPNHYLSDQLPKVIV